MNFKLDYDKINKLGTGTKFEIGAGIGAGTVLGVKVLSADTNTLLTAVQNIMNGTVGAAEFFFKILKDTFNIGTLSDLSAFMIKSATEVSKEGGITSQILASFYKVIAKFINWISRLIYNILKAGGTPGVSAGGLNPADTASMLDAMRQAGHNPLLKFENVGEYAFGNVTWNTLIAFVAICAVVIFVIYKIRKLINKKKSPNPIVDDNREDLTDISNSIEECYALLNEFEMLSEGYNSKNYALIVKKVMSKGYTLAEEMVKDKHFNLFSMPPTEWRSKIWKMGLISIGVLIIGHTCKLF